MALSSHATLLFPRGARDAFDDDDDDDRPAARLLDSVGALRVLGAMVEQRRQSYPPPPAPPSVSGLEVDTSAFDDADEDDEDTAVMETHQRPIVLGARSAEEAPARSRRSIGFLKIR